jgi:hypothetical protein
MNNAHRSTPIAAFDDPSFAKLLDPETKAVLAKIEARTQDEIVLGLIRTGVLTSDGRHLTEKYGGS